MPHEIGHYGGDELGTFQQATPAVLQAEAKRTAARATAKAARAARKRQQVRDMASQQSLVEAFKKQQARIVRPRRMGYTSTPQWGDINPTLSTTGPIDRGPWVARYMGPRYDMNQRGLPDQRQAWAFREEGTDVGGPRTPPPGDYSHPDRFELGGWPRTRPDLADVYKTGVPTTDFRSPVERQRRQLASLPDPMPDPMMSVRRAVPNLTTDWDPQMPGWYGAAPELPFLKEDLPFSRYLKHYQGRL